MSNFENIKRKSYKSSACHYLLTLNGQSNTSSNEETDSNSVNYKNRVDWNRWTSQYLSDEEKYFISNLKDAYGNVIFSDLELTAHNPEERALIEKSFYQRSGFLFDYRHPDFFFVFNNINYDDDFVANNLVFTKGTVFDNSHFNRNAVFDQCVFVGYASFKNCEFEGAAKFDRSYFIGSSFFEKSIFKTISSFENVEFRTYTNFNRCIFNGPTNFLNTKFFSTLHFSNAVFHETCSFVRCQFQLNSIFVKSSFHFMTSFFGSYFSRFPPNFHEATIFSGTSFLNVKWPDQPNDVEEASAYIGCYQRLKQLMETLKKHEDELDFFALEMAAKRVVDGGWTSPRGFLNGLYALTSDYGRSVARPLALLVFAMWVAFSALVWTAECPLSDAKVCLPNGEQTNLGIGKALGLAATSAVGFLPFKKEVFGEVGASYSSVAHFIMSVQSIVSFGLLFLAGLALRNRFRMK